MEKYCDVQYNYIRFLSILIMSRVVMIDEYHESLTKSVSLDCEQSKARNQKFRKKWSLPQVYVEVEGRVDVGKPNRNLVD